MRKTLLSSAIVTISLILPAQAQLFSPYLMGGMNLTRNMGYHPYAAIGGVGVQSEVNHFLFTVEGFVDNSQKIDSGTGWTARGRGVMFFRPTKDFFFGGGMSYSALWTVPYEKNAWHPRAGGGYDHSFESFSLRAQAEYVFAGTDHYNGLQGPEFNVYMPSPRSHAHWLYRETVGAYRYYLTPGVPGNLFGTESKFTVIYRF